MVTKCLGTNGSSRYRTVFDSVQVSVVTFAFEVCFALLDRRTTTRHARSKRSCTWDYRSTQHAVGSWLWPDAPPNPCMHWGERYDPHVNLKSIKKPKRTRIVTVASNVFACDPTILSPLSLSLSTRYTHTVGSSSFQFQLQLQLQLLERPDPLTGTFRHPTWKATRRLQEPPSASSKIVFATIGRIQTHHQHGRRRTKKCETHKISASATMASLNRATPTPTRKPARISSTVRTA